jgi:hypothetical protein
MAGVAFSTGMVFQTSHLLSWQDVDTRMTSGQVCVISRTNRNARASMPAKDTDNAVILPILCSAMREHAPTEQSQYGEAASRHQRVVNKKALLGWLAALAVVAIIVIASFSFTNSTPEPPKMTAPSGRSYAPPVAPRIPTYIPPATPNTAPASESKTVYHVPTYMSAELGRDSQVIDFEKAKAEQMESQLDRLGREIEQKRLYLDRASQFDIDQFNRKVDAYNALLGRVQTQNQVVNQLVERYNEKLRTNGR